VKRTARMQMIAVGHKTLDWAEELDGGDGDPRLMRSALAGFAGLAVDVVGSLEWNGRGLDFARYRLVWSGVVRWAFPNAFVPSARLHVFWSSLVFLVSSLPHNA
jgi:hypothetical protein